MGVTRAAEALAVLAVAALLLAPWPSAQQDQSCVSKLLDCAGDLNSTAKPSEKCCSSINETVETQLSCLCSLLRNEDLIKNYVPNVTQALELPKRCGVNESTDICNSIPSPAPSGGSSGTPSGTSSSATDNDKSGSARAITWIGTSGLLMGLLGLSWSIVA